MRSLITGCSGLIGPCLAEYLLAGGDQVHGTYCSSAESLQALASGITVSRCDFTDPAAVAAVMVAARPERIFHLAAQSLPGQSWHDPELTLRVNALGTLHLLESVRQHCRHAMLLVFGSSAAYGECPQGALDEGSPLWPDSPYGISKAAGEMLADVYRRAYGLRVIRVRPFFIVGPGRARNALVDFAQRMVAAEHSSGIDEIDVGRQSTVRDLLDVRDAVAAIALLAERGQPGDVYNVCSGKGLRIRAALEAMAKLSAKPLRLRFQGGDNRPLDAAALVGDNTRLRQLGWEPRIPLQQTLADMVNFWRAQWQRADSSPAPVLPAGDRR